MRSPVQEDASGSVMPYSIIKQLRYVPFWSAFWVLFQVMSKDIDFWNDLGASLQHGGDELLRTQGSLFLRVRIYDRAQFLYQPLNLGFRGIPYDAIIHAAIIVDKAVSHSSNLLPFNSGESVPNVLRNFFCGFTDNFKAPDKSSLLKFIAHKLFEFRLRHLTAQEFGLNQDVPKKFNR